MTKISRNLKPEPYEFETQTESANCRFLKNCRNKYDEANSTLKSLGECDRSRDTDLREIDLALQLQADALQYAAKVGSLSGTDVLEKFDLWMVDYQNSLRDALPSDSLALITSIIEDLKRIFATDNLSHMSEI